MLRKKLQVAVSGGIHLAIAVELSRIPGKTGTHVFLKSGKKMVSIREYRRILTLAVRQGDQVELIVDGEEEEAVMEQMERILSRTGMP